MFHTDHANKAGAGGAIADTTLSSARLALRSQTGLSGQRISATPKYLLVPAALETSAEKWLATIATAKAAAKAADVNPFAGPFAGSLALVVEPPAGTSRPIPRRSAVSDMPIWPEARGAGREPVGQGCGRGRDQGHPRLRGRVH